MKVCVLTTGFPRFAGDLFGSFVLELCRELAAQGVELEVVAPHEGGIPRRELVDGVRIWRFIYMLPTSWQRVAYGGGIPTNLKQSWAARLQVPFFLASFWWRAWRSSRRVDLVHCHWTICGLVGYLATRGRCPLVLSVRGSDIHLLEGGMMGGLNRWIYRRMDMLIAVSQDIAAKLGQSGVPREKIQVVYNGVDRRFRPRDRQEARQELGLPAAAFILLFVGLLVPVKGVEVLLEALEALGDRQMYCVLVGGGPLETELKAQVQARSLEAPVLFAGPRPTAQIPVWMNAADVLVLPSYSEGRPNVVLEAQACGLPVIATRVGGTPELIRDGETGLLVDSGDEAQLALALAGLKQNSEYRRRLGQAGRQSVQGCTWEASALQVRAIYDQLLGVRC
ncbi:MAG: glycosyltransferase [Candidatus Latescibacteria bacterium]|nr:glycosyltransferase [Candidatus Latescibacterota bacterium]